MLYLQNNGPSNRGILDYAKTTSGTFATTVTLTDMPLTTCCGSSVNSSFWHVSRKQEFHCRTCDKEVKLRTSSRREKTAEQWVIKPKLFGFLGYTVEHTPAKTYRVKVQKYVPVIPSSK